MLGGLLGKLCWSKALDFEGAKKGKASRGKQAKLGGLPKGSFVLEGLLMLEGIRGRLCEWKVCLCKGGFAEAKLSILSARKRRGGSEMLGGVRGRLCE